LKTTLNKASTSTSIFSSHPQVANTYNITDILNRFPSQKSKAVTIQDLQSEIALLKEEIREIKAKQELDRLVLQQLQLSANSDNFKPIEIQPRDNVEFLNYLSKVSIQKWHIRVTLVVNKSFALETVALFDTGAYFNCI
jgi:hypothetical protein